MGPSAPGCEPVQGLICAHRGAPAMRPQNTRPSFRAAMAAGADVLEMDVRATGDQVLVVAHDADRQRVSGGRGAKAPPRRLAFAQVQHLA